MKPGDLVEWRGGTATVVKVYKRNVPDGNPNGDFVIERTWDILSGTDIVRIARRLRVISEG